MEGHRGGGTGKSGSRCHLSKVVFWVGLRLGSSFVGSGVGGLVGFRIRLCHVLGWGLAMFFAGQSLEVPMNCASTFTPQCPPQNWWAGT